MKTFQVKHPLKHLTLVLTSLLFTMTITSCQKEDNADSDKQPDETEVIGNSPFTTIPDDLVGTWFVAIHVGICHKKCFQ